MIQENKLALIIIDMQNDFLPGGALGVQNGDKIIPVLNSVIKKFEDNNCSIFFTRDWHPKDHISFNTWPTHCVQNTWGAEFAKALYIPKSTHIISKATEIETEAYSGFKQTDLHNILQEKGITTIVIGGIATDYCVYETVLDACKLGYKVTILNNGIAGVNLKKDDSANALKLMQDAGAQLDDEV